MGPCSVSVASQNNTYYTCLNIVNFIDPIPAFAGMTKKQQTHPVRFASTPPRGVRNAPATDGTWAPVSTAQPGGGYDDGLVLFPSYRRRPVSNVFVFLWLWWNAMGPDLRRGDDVFVFFLSYWRKRIASVILKILALEFEKRIIKSL